jgi:CheY-like chemotaxis protein
MTENFLLEPPSLSQNAGLAETNAYGAERGAAETDGVILFDEAHDNCALVVRPDLLLREMAQLAGKVFPANISVQADVPTELWPIRGDHGAIHQALSDVVLNAHAAMEEGGRLVLSARNVTMHEAPDTPFFDAPAGDYVEIVVADTGPDIDQEAEGLSIGPGFARTAQVLRTHGGYARIEARAGEGTTVFLDFPRALSASAPIEAGTGPAKHAAGRILIVDDEEAILELCCQILARAGYDVLAARNGGEALSLFALQRSEIGLVLTDLAMPDMNGFTLAWALRRSKPDLRVMVATGEDIEDDLPELERMGVRPVLLKPFSPKHLLDAIARTFTEPVRCEPGLFLVETVVNELAFA